MNRFELGGKVVRVEGRETKMGTPFDIVDIDDGVSAKPIPIALFGYLPAVVGDKVKVIGILEERNGYPSLLVRSVEGVEKRQQTPKIAGRIPTPPPGKAERMGAEMAKKSRMESVKASPSEDDILPF